MHPAPSPCASWRGGCAGCRLPCGGGDFIPRLLTLLPANRVFFRPPHTPLRAFGGISSGDGCAVPANGGTSHLSLRSLNTLLRVWVRALRARGGTEPPARVPRPAYSARAGSPAPPFRAPPRFRGRAVVATLRFFSADAPQRLWRGSPATPSCVQLCGCGLSPPLGGVLCPQPQSCPLRALPTGSWRVLRNPPAPLRSRPPPPKPLRGSRDAR